jgi:hypothetical protein
MDGSKEKAVEEVEDRAITAIREALSGTEMRVSQHDDHGGGLFSDIDSFVKLSQGNHQSNQSNFSSIRQGRR